MIWVDGTVIPDDGLTISVLDRTFEHGLGLFETLRTWGGRPTLLEEHKARMLRSAEELRIPIDPASLPDAVEVARLLEAEGFEGDRLLRITATGGTASGMSVVWMRSGPLPMARRAGGAIVCVNSWSLPIVVSPETREQDSRSAGLALPITHDRQGEPCPTLLASRFSFSGVHFFRRVGLALPFPMRALKPVGRASPTLRSEGSRLRHATGKPVPLGDRPPEAIHPPVDFTARHKTLNYWFKRVAHEQASDLGYDETLILAEPWGYTEASRSNLFLVIGDELLTISTEAPIVPGIMRQLILEVATEAPLQPQEARTLTLDQLRSADEIFLTNAVRGIIPVARIDTPGGSIERPSPGPSTIRLQEQIARRLWPDRGTTP
jgi:branched-subunit amino acid aminotransferase/4-amino-4-deoxychorismate lyase